MRSHWFSINIACLTARFYRYYNKLIKNDIQFSHPIRDEMVIETNHFTKRLSL